MLLISILLGTLIAGIGSVWIAAALSFGVLARYTQHMLSMAAGALLATAFTHLLPEAFESQIDAHSLFMVLLGGLIFFFLLDKAELWHHGHEHAPALPTLAQAMRDDGAAQAHQHGTPHDHGAHSHAAHDHAAHASAAHGHSHGHTHHATGGWAVLAGDTVHCFGDGVLIASAFMADTRLGVLAAVAVLAHEVPHHMGDLAVLRQASSNRRAALTKVSLAGAMTALGGLAGYVLVGQLHHWLPYFLVVASSSFIYVALADLIPQLQKRLSAPQTLAQLTWLAVGMGLVILVGSLSGEHEHSHAPDHEHHHAPGEVHDHKH
ncbi:ZIP family metal transporter [Ottowia thiooxydans]|uniref:ZIP family metal transporter n=1 Tax=Ottowia thiooxydans TaxID=219182 RepID=UPI000421BC91|nr:ZIP family metal transporter [Ottowia thiooxydans]